MTELLYSGDKQRLLDELASPRVSSVRLPALEDPEHIDALHDLFGQVVGLPKEEPAEPKARAQRMTHTELKAMKACSEKVETPKVSIARKFSRGVIQMWCALRSLFSVPTRKSNIVTCKQNGHVCTHCGTHIPY